MQTFQDAKAAAQRNFDTKIAFSTALGVAGLGVVAFLMHKSNVKVLKQAANIATAKKAGK